MREAALDRLCELANIGAGHASDALARVLGRPIRMEVPRVRGWGPGGGADPPPDATGVLFQVEGGLGGLLAVLFPAPAREELLTRLLGSLPGPGTHPPAVSALAEVGNMLASHALSAVADTLGTRVVPSIPRVVRGPASALLAVLASAWPGEAATPWIETSLVERDGTLRARLVWLPSPREAASDASRAV